MDECVFCKIVRGELPSDVIAENEKFLAFTPLEDLAAVHALVIPRAHVASIAGADGLDTATLAEMPLFIAQVASGLGLDQSGYRVATNHGPDARQSVNHLHWHILGGEPLSESM